MLKPVAIDLGSGRGGWVEGLRAAGWFVIAVDLKRYKDNPADLFIQADILKLDPLSFKKYRPLLVVASPTCTEFSKADQPALYPNLPAPSMDLVNACEQFARAIGVPLVLENVRGLQKFKGTAVHHYGSFYLWGDGVPCLLPKLPGRQGRPRLKWQHRSPSMRAKIPYELAYWIGQVHVPPRRYRRRGAANLAGVV